jgi:tetratricopeptide (TPR) repeat protein
MKWHSAPILLAALLLGVPLAANLWLALGDRITSSPAAVHIARGDRALAEGRYSEAVIAFGRAQKLDPQSAPADLGVTRARVHGVADEPSRLRDDYESELRYDVELLLERDPKSAAACHVALGHLAARKGDLASARAKYEEAVKVDPASPLAHTALGNAYLNDRDRAGQAAASFDAALKARPGHASALVGLARVALTKGDPQEAVRHLTAALVARDDYNARLLLGNTQVRLKNLSDGIAHLERAVKLEPQSTEALRSLGQALMAADRSVEAERPLRAAAQGGDDTEAATTLGFALARQRRHGAALDAFTQVLAREPDSPLALFGAGVALEELGKRDEALASYKRLLALKPPPGREIPGLAQVQDDAKQRVAALQGGPPEPAPAPSAISRPSSPAP